MYAFTQKTNKVELIGRIPFVRCLKRLLFCSSKVFKLSFNLSPFTSLSVSAITFPASFCNKMSNSSPLGRLCRHTPLLFFFEKRLSSQGSEPQHCELKF